MKSSWILAAFGLQFLAVVAALGAGTQTTALSTAGGASPAYTDLGAAPLQVQAIGGDIRIVVSDSSPSLALAGNVLPQNQYQTFNPADAGSHVWALGLNGAPSASYAPIYSAGAGGGGAITAPLGSTTAPSSAVATTDTGTPITGQTIPAGGQGITGWLSAIYSAIVAPLSAQTSHNILIGAVEGNGVAGTPDTHVVTVQGAPSGTAVPVSAASLPLPTGAASAANQTSGSNYGNQANFVSGKGSATGTGATTIITAPGSNKLYITGAQCFRTDAGTTAAYVTFNDGASTVMGLANSGGGGGNNMVFSTPLVVAATTAFTFTASGSLTTVYCNAQGYNAP